MKKVYVLVLLLHTAAYCAEVSTAETSTVVDIETKNPQKENWVQFFRRKLNALTQSIGGAPKDIATADLEDDAVIISRVNHETTAKLHKDLAIVIASLEKAQEQLDVSKDEHLTEHIASERTIRE